VTSYGQGPPGGAFLLYAALAGTAEAGGVAALYRGLSVGVMSIVAPVAATAPVVSTSVLFGGITALGFGSFYVAMDAASEGEISWALLVARLTAVTLFVAALLLARPGVDMRRADLPVIVGIGVLIIAGDSMYATASTHGLLSVVAVLSTLYTVVTIALARAFIGERIVRQQSAGIAMCMGGVVAISAG
jgi:drug/metabolite transporter (DMT)-like permease